jgi:hypothetical protein
MKLLMVVRLARGFTLIGRGKAEKFSGEMRLNFVASLSPIEVESRRAEEQES